MNWYSSFKTRLLIGLFLAITVPLLIFALINLHNLQEISYQDFLRFTRKQMDYVENSISTYLRFMEDHTEYLAAHPKISSADSSITSYIDSATEEGKMWMAPSKAEGLENEIYVVYEQFARANPGAAFLYMAVDETGGYVQWPESYNYDNYDPRKRPWYEKAMETPGVAGRTLPYSGGAAEEVIVSTVITIQDDQGKIIGAQGVDLSLNFLSQLVKEAEPGKTGFVIITDEEGTIIAHSRNPEYNFKSLIDYNAKLGGHVKSGVSPIEINISGVDLFGVVKKSEFTGWTYIGLVEKAELLETSSIIFRHTVLNLVIIIIFFAFLSIVLSRTFTRPVLEVVDQMKKIEKGDLNIELPESTLNRKDELGILARAGRSMSAKIRDKINKLEQINTFGRDLASSLDFDHSLRASAEIMFNPDNAERGLILLTNRSETELEVAISHKIDTPELIRGRHILNNIEISMNLDYLYVEKLKSQNAAEDRPQIYRLEESDQDRSLFITKWMQASECSRLIPMLVKQRLIGFILIEPVSEDEDYLLTMARQISFAIENSKLYHDAITDGLTGLYIHRFFQLSLHREIKRAQRYNRAVTLMMLDIDHFKKFNDTFGHQAGDRVLRGVSDLIKSNVREVDIPCRYGGEELAVILPDTNIEQAKIVAEKIRKLIEEQTFFEESTITVSIGLAQVDEELKDNKQLIGAADKCLYIAKEKGRNLVIAWEK